MPFHSLFSDRCLLLLSAACRYEKAFNLDWSMALRSHGLAKFILKHDDGESDDEGEDVDGDGIADDELVEVGHVLWTHHSLIYKAFDSYASIGASGGSAGDMTRISVSGFKQFCHDCKIVVKGSASCSQAHLDQLFVLVNQIDHLISTRRQQTMWSYVA